MCVPGEDRTCISPIFYMDEINNCPPPCRDELQCTPKNEYVTVSHSSSTNIIISAVSSLIITMMVVCFCLWMCWKLYFKNSDRRNNYDRNSRALVSPSLASPAAIPSPSPAQIQDNQIELPNSMENINLERQRRRQSHEQQQQQHQQTNDDDTIVEKDLPPSYESLFPINSVS